MEEHNENKQYNPEHKSYWIKKMSGEFPILNLPNVKLHKKVKSFKGYAFRSIFSNEEVQLLNNFIISEKGSLFSCLLASLNILFYRYTSQQDIILGTKTFGVDNSDFSTEINCLPNTIILRAEIDPCESFNSFYQRIEKTRMLDYKNQTYSFNQLVTDLNITIDEGRNTIFDIMVSFDKTKYKTDNIDDYTYISNNIIDLGEKILKYDMEILFQEIDNILYFNICMIVI